MLPLLLLCSLALGQEPEAVQGPRLPQVFEGVAPSYPPDALTEGLDATVLLEVDVSAEGEVLDARVVDASDARFGPPAVDAMRAYRFSPAIDAEGLPSSARIQYRLVFRAEAALPVSAEGLLRSIDGQALAGVLVTARSAEGGELYATTDDTGAFRFVGLESGPWTILATSDLYLTKEVEITVSEGMVQELSLALEERPEPEQGVGYLVVEVVGEGLTDQVTERVISAREIEFLPGSSGDVVKAVQNLPGVARSPSGIGQLIIRGSPPEDSEFGLDGARIPLVFHFSGLTTVLSTESIDEVAYLPGSYGVRYGRALGGYVDLRLSPEPGERRSVASLDLYQAQLFTEQPLGENTSISVSGRRSYIDTVLSPILSKGDTTVQAPRYYDAQVRLAHITPRGDNLELMYLMSDDSFRFLGKNADGEDETLAALATRFHKLRVRHLAGLGPDTRLESLLLLGPEVQEFEFAGQSEAYEKSLALNLREELQRELSEDRRLGYRLGIDLLCGRDSYLYDVGSFGEREEGQAWTCAPAPYAEATVRLGTLRLTPGVRLDSQFLPFATLYSFDPRLGARWSLGDRTTLKAGTGLYSQLPTLRQLNPDSDGNPDLVPERAWQSSLGVEYQLSQAIRIDLSGYYSQLDNLVVGREERFYFFSGPPLPQEFDTKPYANLGTGLTCGVEALVRYTDDRTVAQVAATFGHSERTGRDGIDRLFAYDQPLILNALVSRELPRGWRLGGRVRFTSGNPYAPVINAVYRLEERDWLPVYDSGQSARLRPFFSLDLRVDRTWTFERWELTTYLDIQNVTYYQNVEVMFYSADYREEDPVAGLPTLPTFGFKGVW